MWAIWRACWRFRPHIVHPVNYHSNLLTRMLRLILPPSTKLIGTVRVEYTPKQLRYERFSHWACRKMICNSPHIQQQLIESAHIPDQKICVIPNGVDINRFRNADGDSIRSKITPDSTKLFLSVGRISKQKAQHHLVEAIGQLKSTNRLDSNFHLILMGEVEELGIQNKIESLIKQYNLSEMISQLSPMSHPEQYYQAADVTVLYSDYEGLANVILESLAAGKPIIISEQANAANIIEDNQTGWIVPNADSKHLAETIAAVMNLPEDTLMTMQDACYQRAQDFAMDNMIARYTTLYPNL
jgi:glycosyltransferase involved in cell wall biosynthesis